MENQVDKLTWEKDLNGQACSAHLGVGEMLAIQSHQVGCASPHGGSDHMGVLLGDDAAILDFFVRGNRRNDARLGGRQKPVEAYQRFDRQLGANIGLGFLEDAL